MTVGRLHFAMLGSLLLSSTWAWAGPMSVQEAIDRALADHPSLKTAQARVQSAKAAHAALWESYAPQITLFGGAQSNDISGSTTTTAAGFLGSTTTVTEHFSNSDVEAIAGGNVEEFLFDFGSFAGQRRATGERHAAQKDALASQRLDVEQNVKVAYYNLILASRLLRFNQDAVDHRRDAVSQIAALVKKEPGRRKDLPQIELDLADARIKLARSQTDYAGAEATFSEALGEPSTSTHSLVDDVTLKPILIGHDQAVRRAMNARPELGQIQALVRAQQADVDAAWASYFPRVSTFFSVTSLTPFAGEQSFDQLTVIAGGVKIGVPTTGLVTTERLNQAQANLEEAKSREREIQQAITFAVDKGFDNLAEAVERIRIGQELLQKANQNWNEIQNGYRRGRSTMIENTIAYRFLYDSQVRLIQALYDAKIAEARLERAIGFDF